MLRIETIERAIIDGEDSPWRVYAGGPAPRLWTPLMSVDAARRVADEARARLIDENLFNGVEIRFTKFRTVCGVEIIPKK